MLLSEDTAAVYALCALHHLRQRWDLQSQERGQRRSIGGQEVKDFVVVWEYRDMGY